jgi:hypothetical protein
MDFGGVTMESSLIRKIFNTDNAIKIGYKFYGDAGKPDCYIERLYVREDGQHFLFSFGGSGSPYAVSKIKLISIKQAIDWLDSFEQ